MPAAKVEPRMQGSPAVAPFLRLRLVEEELARGNAQNAAAVASEIIALGDTSSATTIARLRLPAIYAQLGDRASADAAFQQAMLIPIDELTEEDFVALGTALAKNGRDDLAIKTRMRLLTEYTQGRFTEQTYGFLRNEVMKLSESEQLAIAKQLARYDRYDQALEVFDRLTRTEEVRNARLRALFNSRHYEQLLEETKDTKLEDPSLALLRARAAWRVDRRPEFLAGLDAVNTPEAAVLRSKYYTTDEIDYPRAIDNLRKAIDAGAVGGAEGENIWNLGYTYVLAGKYQEALQTFDRYIAAYPDGDWKTNSLFWSAKILDRAGRTAERDAKARQIVDEYPFSYYSYRAKDLWGDVGAAALSGTATAEGSGRHIPFPDINTFPDEPRLAVVRELLDLGFARDATREMKLIAAKYPDHPAIQFMLADVYVKGGEPLKANGVLQRRFRQFVRHGGTNIPRRFWEILFPLPHWDVIQKEAEKRALDPYLIASIIRQESAFEPSTVSNAGAVGLMQIMPEEATRIAGTVTTRESLFDPATNIAVGAAEYSQKLALMNGNHTLAIAAYNAGEEAVRGWTSSTPLQDIDLFIESIPFAETRLYVKTVNRNRNEYRRIYER
ncbi:MAG TPA: transglycosylase SLT domain-containing protein [Thermoanaerobaculia bacterium]|nr:transglycosylase SLT domain-containing protein [Thermoanaerobaculia bacterium]